MRHYRPRKIEARLLRAARQFPVIVLTGPRQSGKSTLLKHLFPGHRHVSLDDPLQRALARRDPKLFLESHGSRIFIDEIQYAPELLPYLKMDVDRNRRKAGRFLLSGSQIFPLMAGLSETLAGRAALYELLAFSWEELSGGPAHTVRDCFQQMWRGFYPDPAVHRVSVPDFYASYLQTYLERDIRQIQAVQDLAIFQNFLELLAARIGGILNLQEVAKECGISQSGARRWLSLLETTRIVYLLRPYARNVTKRVVKRPKLYFTDTGLAAYLLRYRDAETLQMGPMAGSFFENMLIVEFLKRKFNRGGLYELYFYRDSNGKEADLLIEGGKRKFLIEIKTARTLRLETGRSLALLARDFSDCRSYVLSFAEEMVSLATHVRAVPWQRLEEVAIEIES